MSRRCSIRRSKSRTSSSPKALASDSMRSACVTCAKAPDGAAPTRWVGVGRGQAGMFGLQRLEFAHQAVVLDVRDVRLVEAVVAMVGVVDQAAQFGDAGGGFGGHWGVLGHRVWWMRALAWYSRDRKSTRLNSSH